MNLLLVRVCILKPKYGWIRTLFWKKQQHNFSCISVLEYCHMNIFFSIHLLPCLTNQLRDKNFIFQLFLHAFQINIYIYDQITYNQMLWCAWTFKLSSSMKLFFEIGYSHTMSMLLTIWKLFSCESFYKYFVFIFSCEI